MAIVSSCELPEGSLLQPYCQPGTYTDCYVTSAAGDVIAEDFFRAFYTTWLFGIERWILARAIDKPSTDTQAAELAAGQLEVFSAWRVEDRSENQLLMADFRGNTRSWLMTAQHNEDGRSVTRLYFGSAVLPRAVTAGGEQQISMGFRALLGFHKLYSVALLRAAAAKL